MIVITTLTTRKTFDSTLTYDEEPVALKDYFSFSCYRERAAQCSLSNFPIRTVRVEKNHKIWWSGTEKRCSHNLQSCHPAWWSADNGSIFPTVIHFRLVRSKKRTGRRNQSLKKLKKIISCIFVFLAYRICLSVLKLREKLKRKRVRS